MYIRYIFYLFEQAKNMQGAERTRKLPGAARSDPGRRRPALVLEQEDMERLGAVRADDKRLLDIRRLGRARQKYPETGCRELQLGIGLVHIAHDRPGGNDQHQVLGQKEDRAVTQLAIVDPHGPVLGHRQATARDYQVDVGQCMGIIEPGEVDLGRNDVRQRRTSPLRMAIGFQLADRGCQSGSIRGTMALTAHACQ